MSFWKLENILLTAIDFMGQATCCCALAQAHPASHRRSGIMAAGPERKVAEWGRLLQHAAMSPCYCPHVAGLLLLLECALVPAIITRISCERDKRHVV